MFGYSYLPASFNLHYLYTLLTIISAIEKYTDNCSYLQMVRKYIFFTITVLSSVEE
jgi:hypothetical protein